MALEEGGHRGNVILGDGLARTLTPFIYLMKGVVDKTLPLTLNDQVQSLIGAFYPTLEVVPALETGNMLWKFVDILDRHTNIYSLREDLGSYRARTNLFCTVWNLHDLAILTTVLQQYGTVGL